jgi:hypothetical protein
MFLRVCIVYIGTRFLFYPLPKPVLDELPSLPFCAGKLLANSSHQPPIKFGPPISLPSSSALGVQVQGVQELLYFDAIRVEGRSAGRRRRPSSRAGCTTPFNPTGDLGKLCKALFPPSAAATPAPALGTARGTTPRAACGHTGLELDLLDQGAGGDPLLVVGPVVLELAGLALLAQRVRLLAGRQALGGLVFRRAREPAAAPLPLMLQPRGEAPADQSRRGVGRRLQHGSPERHGDGRGAARKKASAITTPAITPPTAGGSSVRRALDGRGRCADYRLTPFERKPRRPRLGAAAA